MKSWEYWRPFVLTMIIVGSFMLGRLSMVWKP